MPPKAKLSKEEIIETAFEMTSISEYGRGEKRSL